MAVTSQSDTKGIECPDHHERIPRDPPDRSRSTTIVSNWIGQAIENDIARMVEAEQARGSNSTSCEFIGDITGIPPRAAARHRGMHLALSTQYEKPAHRTIRNHITSTINQEGTSWHSKSTCS